MDTSLRVEIEERTARAPDGARIAYSLRPAKGTSCGRVLLVHALAQDRSNWDGVLAALPADLDVIALDGRGHGASDAGEGPFTVERFADDLAAVLDAAGWPDALVAGCSMGGCVALAFAHRHPARCAALALVDTTAWYGPEASTVWRARAETAAAGGLSSLVPFQIERWFGESFRRTEPERVSRTVTVFEANRLAAYERSCDMLGAVDLREAAGSLDLPTAIVVGEEDYATPPEMARALNDAIRGSSLAILPGARHFTPIERPEEVAAILASLAGKARRA